MKQNKDFDDKNKDALNKILVEMKIINLNLGNMNKK